MPFGFEVTVSCGLASVLFGKCLYLFICSIYCILKGNPLLCYNSPFFDSYFVIRLWGLGLGVTNLKPICTRVCIVL